MAQRKEVLSILRRHINSVLVHLTTNVATDLVENTAIDTGFAMTNWISTIGEPRQETSGTYAQAREGMLFPGPQESGLRALLHYTLREGNLYVSNNVEYITQLNDTTYPRFVQIAIVRGIRETLRTAPTHGAIQ